MIKAKHHFFIYPLFQWLTSFLIKRHFNQVVMEGEFPQNNQSVLVVANHVSWWDGFWVEYLNLKRFQKKFYFMMLEEQLKKHWYFQYTGGFSIKKKSKEAMESLTYAASLLMESNNLVLMFPQGKIHSIYKNNVPFEKGIERILSQVPGETPVLFVANFVDYFSNNKPNVYMYQQNFLARDFETNSIETEYHRFYQEKQRIQQEKTS